MALLKGKSNSYDQSQVADSFSHINGLKFDTIAISLTA